MDINKIIEKSKEIGTEELVDNDISQDIIDIAKKVYEQHPDIHPWFRGIDMMKKLKHHGKKNVRKHLENLEEKETLEGRLHGTKKVYRLRVIEEDD